MPQISLAEYNRKIAEQIENDQIDRAIAHCRHILSHYPRYVPAYELLAHACLEKGDFAHANHFFQCVLSADLENADAWMNLALLVEDLGEIEQAIWLLERAFEVAPGNTRVRELLLRWYMQRDGSERNRIKLTPTALARLYAKGGFYRRTIRELEKMLQQSAALPRLQVATLEVSLAQALWNTRELLPLAARICESLLQKVPSSLQANVILGDIHARAGRPQESESYLQVARMLDPEGKLAYELLGHESPLPVQDVKISYLEYQAPPVEEVQAVAPEAEDTSWLDRIGEGVEPLALEDEQQAPAWIKDWADEEMLMPTSADQEFPSEDRARPGLERTPLSAQPSQEAELEVPDWLLEVQRESAAPDTREDIPDWLQDLSEEAWDESEIEAAQDQLPEWLQELEPEESVEASIEAADRPTLKGDVPDWLSELSQAEGLETSTETDSALEKEWADLSEEQAELPPPDTIQPEKATRPLRAPVALEDTDQPELEEELPPWFDELRREAETAISAEPAQAAAQVPAADKTPGWLRELEAEISGAGRPAPIAQVEAPQAPEETPPVKVLETPKPPAAAPEPPVEVLEAAEQPDWLQELEERTAPEAAPEAVLEPTPADELPDWLEELRRADRIAETALPETEAELEAAPEAELEPMPDEELPDWLRELRAEPELAETLTPTREQAELVSMDRDALEPVPEDELPDWLQQLRPAGEAQRDQELPSPAEAEPLAAAEPLVAEVPAVGEFEPPLADQMEDMEWLRELEQIEVGEVPQADTEPLALPTASQVPETERISELETIALFEAPIPGVPVAPSAPEAAEPAEIAAVPAAQALDSETRLTLARTRLSEYALDDSAQEYEQLVREPSTAEQLVEELEQAVRTHPDHHALQRVLGDAYMRTGKLQKALQAYRQALSKL